MAKNLFQTETPMSGPNHPRSPMDMKPDPEMGLGGYGGLYGASKIQPPSPEGLTSSSIVSKAKIDLILNNFPSL